MYCKCVAWYKPTKETYQQLSSMNSYTTLKPQSKNLIRKNISNYTATEFQENSRIGEI